MLEHLFDCVICKHEVVDYPNRDGRQRQIAPICRSCESYWGDRGPTSGAFMDRRQITRLSAIANCLHNTASIMEWERMHARS